MENFPCASKTCEKAIFVDKQKRDTHARARKQRISKKMLPVLKCINIFA